MSERAHYQALKDGARLDGWTLVRIDDGTVTKNPFDFWGFTQQGIVIGLEVKEDKRKLPNTIGPVDPSYFKGREHQITWLNEIIDNNGIALVAIYFTVQKEMILYDATGKLSHLHKVNGLWRGWCYQSYHPDHRPHFTL